MTTLHTNDAPTTHLASIFEGNPTYGDLAALLAPDTLWAIDESYFQRVAQWPLNININALGALERSVPTPGRPRSSGAIGLMRIRGVITHHSGNDLFSMLFGGASIDSMRAEFRELLADEEVRAILIDIDSPGGSVFGVQEFAEEIYNSRGKKPIVAVSNDVAASAAYWLGSQADQFYTTPSGVVGSIGVYTTHQEITGALEKMGIKTTLISAGKWKTLGSPLEALTDEGQARIQRRVDTTYDTFVAAVAKGRGTTADAVRNGFGEGDIVMSAEAQRMGMVDGVMTLERAATKAATLRPAQRAMAEAAAMTYAESAEQIVNDVAAISERAEMLAIRRVQLPEEVRTQLHEMLANLDQAVVTIRERIPDPRAEALREQETQRVKEDNRKRLQMMQWQAMKERNEAALASAPITEAS